MVILIALPHKLPEMNALITAAANGKLLIAANPAINAATVDVTPPGIVYVVLYKTLLATLAKSIVDSSDSSI